jgi:GTP cyclohydrolase I
MVPEEFTFTTFDKEDYDQMIVQKDISFFSLCEHHLAPFFGTATVAYIPNKKIVGLSKIARCVRYYAAGLQNQERVTMKIAQRIQEELNPKGVAVILDARHLCMEMRGVKTFGAGTVTSEMIGAFRDEAETRNELLNFIKK